MSEEEIRQDFRNQSNCYADTGRFESDGSYTEGDVIQAMTEDAVVALVQAKVKTLEDLLSGAVDLLSDEGLFDYKHYVAKESSNET